MALKIITASFVKGAVKAEQFPALGVPEFAFFGRSNAGKSSLINMLVNRKNLVKTGARPGMTREINFFLINGRHGADGVRCERGASLRSETERKMQGARLTANAGKKDASSFVLTDLPGYGYAKVSGASALQIDTMLYEYCSAGRNLKRLFFLIDMRREPCEIEKNSVEFFQKNGIDAVIVATKADKLGKNDRIKVKKEWGAYFNVAEDLIITASSLKKIGKEDILAVIESACKER